MQLRDTIRVLEERGKLVRVTAPISKTYEIAGVLKRLEPTPVLFENVIESDFQVVGNLFCGKPAFADVFGVRLSEIIPTLTRLRPRRTHLDGFFPNLTIFHPHASSIITPYLTST